MEETGELVKPRASGSANANPNKARSRSSREEGELSSSDDDELAVCSAATSTCTAVPSTGCTSVPPASKSTRGIQEGMTVSGNSSIDIRPRTSSRPNNQKNIEKNPVPFKPANPGWHRRNAIDRNLVISFSDDDSGSESEIQRRVKDLQGQLKTTAMVGDRRPPASSLTKSNRLQQPGRNTKKVMPKNLPSNSTVNGGVNAAVARPSSIEQRSQVRKFNPLNKNLRNQEHQCDQSASLTNSKLQDLRQQIALRESELKLKIAQQNKEYDSVSCRGYNTINLSNEVAKRNAASGDVGQSGTKEPDKKHLKVSGAYSGQLTPEGRQQTSAATSVLPSKKLASEKGNLQDGDKCDRSQEGISVSIKESGIVKWKQQDDKCVDVLSEDVPGADLITSCHQFDRTSGEVNPRVMSPQIALEANMVSSTLPEDIAFLNNGSLWSSLGNRNVPGHSRIDVESFVEMEESLDKELEQAQEHRRICEIEERNALKAYRRAQRSLIEANGRCADLYRRREMCSAQFRSFIMDDSSLLWSKQHEHVGNGIDTLANITKNVDMIPKPCRNQLECDGFNQTDYDSNLHFGIGGPRDMAYRHSNGQNLGSEPCSEPDASTSEPLPCSGKHPTNRLSSPSNDPNISLDEDEETFPMDHESVQHNFESQLKDQNFEGPQKDADNEINKIFSIDGTQESLILEETLRSQLFARLRMRTLSKGGASCDDMEPVVEPAVDSDVGSEKTLMSDGSALFSEAEKDQLYDFGGAGGLERSVSHGSFQTGEQCPVEKTFLKFDSPACLEGNRFSIRGYFLSTECSNPLVLRSTFAHLKMMSQNIVRTESNSRRQKCGLHNVYNEEMQWSHLLANSTSERETGSYTCDFDVDQSWPLCMYELRGKCNNDECPWQHFRDFSNGKMHQKLRDYPDNADCRIGLTSHQQKHDGAMKLSRCCDVFRPPTYFVGLDTLKVDLRSYESVVARKKGQCWRMAFSNSLALSSLLQKDLPVDESFLHESEGRIEVHGSLSGQSYFQSKNAMNQLHQGLVVACQPLEMALLILNQKVNKVEGRKKALAALSRSLEAEPTSEILWIVYLLIYCCSSKLIGKDDMFSYAVKYNEGSYGLWLMYINSRIQLDDRLVAYDAALSVLCRNASASGRDGMHSSSRILDLFLQMIDCFRMSWNIEKAIKRICALLPTAAVSDEPHSLMLSDILTCLKFSDKCVFWICCVYLVIYRKLPDAVVQCFEFEKELSAIEWPSVNLADENKQLALRLLEMGVDSVDLYISNGSVENETNLRSAQLFSLSHIRCMMTLDGLECCRNLLDKYIKLYPSCLELVLISVRMQQNDSEDLSFARFEEILSNWPKEAPGINCIWNQYAEYALQHKSDFARELMARWYSSVWKVQYLQIENLKLVDGENSSGSLELNSPNPGLAAANCNQTDVTFALLNLSLHKLLQKDHVGARSAIDIALKTVAPGNFTHCMREHAKFLLTNGSQSKDVLDIKYQLNILNSYLDHARSIPVPEPFSRQFINKIEKPKVQQLVGNLLTPVSSDFVLVDLVLEAWYGPSLLPQELSKTKDLVDFVEAILELALSNYPLAFSVFKVLGEGNGHTNVDSASILFWASSVLVNAIFHAVPVAPEYIWVEAADILSNTAGVEAISMRFYKKALSVYPFSVKLWKFYHKLSKDTGDSITVMEAARQVGIKLD